MKRLKKLKRDYKIAVSAYGLNPDNWMLKEDGDFYITIINKDSGNIRRIDRYAKPRKGEHK